MTETMTETQQEVAMHERDGRELLQRAFSFQAEVADERTIDVRVVPFDEIVTVADPPDFLPYREQFMPGCFSHQEKAANRILLRAGQGHDAIDENGHRKPGLAGVVGHGQHLIEREDGYHARFKMLGNAEAETARELVNAGVYTGVSAEFYRKKERPGPNGLVQRIKADLSSVLLTPTPAYSKAQVLAMREEEESLAVIAELAPPPPSVALLERCAGLGIELPSGMATLLARAFTEQPWDGSASRWDTAEAYCAASAIDLNTGSGPKSKALCHLPYMEPGSMMVNVNGVRAALSRLGEGFPSDASAAQRDEARVMLEKVLASFKSAA